MIAQDGAVMQGALTYVTANISPNTSHRLQMQDTLPESSSANVAGDDRHQVLSQQIGIWV
jgi:hypothetical protein